MEHLTFNELCNKYNEWWNNRDSATSSLQLQISAYEQEYFKDILLKTSEISQYFTAFDDNMEEIALPYDSNFFDLSLDTHKYTFHIDTLNTCAGLHNSTNHSITIDIKQLSNKEIILHEMVHAYENILDTHKIYALKEIIFLELYKYLQKQNIDVDGRILAHSNLLSNIDITEQGGKHSIFFLLKTLELDLKCNLPLGTICGYDRENY